MQTLGHFQYYIVLSNEDHFEFSLKNKWSQNGSILEPFWKTVPLWRVEPFFFLNNHVQKKMAPASEVALFSETAPGVELFCQICQKGWKWLHFGKSGTNLAPPLAPIWLHPWSCYVPWNSSRWSRFCSTFFLSVQCSVMILYCLFRGVLRLFVIPIGKKKSAYCCVLDFIIIHLENRQERDVQKESTNVRLR